ITIEHNSLVGGVGQLIRTHLGNQGIEISNFGYPDNFIAHGDVKKLYKEIGFTAEAILNQIK
ncbi:MAG: hypothetical protein B6226_05200, partial [Candidatus Cloacimonetes bacterium 4572_65]